LNQKEQKQSLQEGLLKTNKFHRRISIGLLAAITLI